MCLTAFLADGIISSIFAVLWVGLLLFFAYKILRSCWNSRAPATMPTRSASRGSFPSNRGWFPGGDSDSQAPPPPYSKTASTPTEAWQPGFWTGAALGGMGTYLMNRNNRQERSPTRNAPPRRAWDWEQTAPPRTSPRARFDDMDRGEGSSNLGSMRSSTGYGGSRVR